MKKKISLRKIVLFFALLGCAVLLVFLFREPILKEAGSYLAPEATGNADVVILEGDELIKWDGVEIGMRILSSGRANSLVVVVHQDSERRPPFALPDYPLLLAKELQKLKLRKSQFQVIVVPIKHPVTLTEAEIVLSNLSGTGVSSAILLAQGFHTRRSYWVYKQVGLPLGIKVIPCSYFVTYQRENWWLQIQAVEGYFYELCKYFYYVLRGYAPLKSLFCNLADTEKSQPMRESLVMSSFIGVKSDFQTSAACWASNKKGWEVLPPASIVVRYK